MTANVSIPLNKREFCETRLPTSWLWFTLLAVQTYNLSSELATQTHQLHYPLQERLFPTPLLHAEKQQLHWNWAILPLQILHFNRQNLLLITSGESRIIFLPERCSICQYRPKISAINVKKQSRARLLLAHPVLYILKVQKTYGTFWKPPLQNQPKSVIGYVRQLALSPKVVQAMQLKVV